MTRKTRQSSTEDRAGTVREFLRRPTRDAAGPNRRPRTGGAAGVPQSCSARTCVQLPRTDVVGTRRHVVAAKQNECRAPVPAGPTMRKVLSITLCGRSARNGEVPQEVPTRPRLNMDHARSGGLAEFQDANQEREHREARYHVPRRRRPVTPPTVMCGQGLPCAGSPQPQSYEQPRPSFNLLAGGVPCGAFWAGGTAGMAAGAGPPAAPGDAVPMKCSRSCLSSR